MDSVSDSRSVDREAVVSVDELAQRLLVKRLDEGIDTIDLQVVIESSIRHRKERAATVIAVSMVVLVIVTVLLAGLSPYLLRDADRVAAVQGIMDRVLPVLAGMLGVVLGHYFGKQSAQAN